MEIAFGAWVKKRRRRLDLTQEDLAARALCSVNSIRKIERDELTPSKQLAVEIARALSLPPETHADFVRFARTADATADDEAFSGRGAQVPLDTPPVAPVPTERKFSTPAPLTTAIGRERDIKVITQVLRLPATRLVTLTGAPGTGKTRLALQVANELQDELRHGAAMVALASVTQPALVSSALAQALEIQSTAQTPPAQAVRNFLRDQEMLLVLDNFEQLLGDSDGAQAIALVTDLLAHAPRLKILVTSRERLRAYGERELPVTPLAVPVLGALPPLPELENIAAVQLFVERAQAVKPTFELTAENAATIAQLCVELDGLPLAIEMAAARVKWEAPRELLPQLTRRLETLSGRARDMEPRQKTLRAAMDWSYELLDAAEQRTLRHMGVFRNGWTTAAANTVSAGEVRALLESLVEKSLVKWDDETARFSLLGIIREYALEKLNAAAAEAEAEAEAEAKHAHLRHADYFTQRVETLAPNYMRPDWVRVRAELDADRDNLRGALEWAIANDRGSLVLRLVVAMVPYWEGTNALAEGIDWFERVTALDTPTAKDAAGAMQTARWRAELRDGYARFLRMNGHYHHARALFQQAIADWERVGVQGKSHLALTQSELARLALDQGDKALALHAAEQALQLYTELGDSRGQSVAWRRLADLGLLRRDYAYAAQCVAQALAIVNHDESDYERLLILRIRGDVWRAQGDYARAEQDYRAARQLNTRMQDTYVEIRLKRSLGTTAIARGEFGEASHLIAEAAQLANRTGNRAGLALVMLMAAWLAASLGDLERAAQLLGVMDGIHAKSGAQLIAPDAVEYEKTLAILQANAPAETRTQWRAAGQALTLEQALALVEGMLM